MLARCGQALLDALKTQREIREKVRTCERLPQLELKELLQRYASDAPALYLVGGSFRVDDDAAIVSFQLAGVVRNVAGHEQAFAGDGLDLGVDHLLGLAVRTLHGARIGDCMWAVKRGELVDDPLFDGTGLAAVEIHLESSRIDIETDWPFEDLDDFKTFHADMDLPVHAGETEYLSWLQEPPVYTNSNPDLSLHQSLQGA